MAELFNTHYAGFADFPEKNAEYVAFLSELHRRLSAKGVNVSYRRGNSHAAYAGNWLLTIFIFVMLAVVFVMLLTWHMTEMALIKLGIVLFFIPTLIRYMQRAAPGRYDPLDIPDDLLPAPE
jgi:hypothetical protein